MGIIVTIFLQTLLFIIKCKRYFIFYYYYKSATRLDMFSIQYRLTRVDSYKVLKLEKPNQKILIFGNDTSVCPKLKSRIFAFHWNTTSHTDFCIRNASYVFRLNEKLKLFYISLCTKSCLKRQINLKLIKPLFCV